MKRRASVVEIPRRSSEGVLSSPFPNHVLHRVTPRCSGKYYVSRNSDGLQVVNRGFNWIMTFFTISIVCVCRRRRLSRKLEMRALALDVFLLARSDFVGLGILDFSRVPVLLFSGCPRTVEFGVIPQATLVAWQQLSTSRFRSQVLHSVTPECVILLVAQRRPYLQADYTL